MMNRKRIFQRFTHKGANFRICCDRAELITREIVRQRGILEDYIRRHPEFGASLTPLAAKADAPEVALRMARAGEVVGVGPMAAVAGTMAQLAAEAAIGGGAPEAVVENGGDMYLVCKQPIVVGLYAGRAPLGERFAFAIEPDRTPLAVCSSSGRMGHSMSLGDCDLATVTAADASLADAAATWAANLVKTADDIEPALRRITAIQGVSGVLLIKGERVGMMGDLPELVTNQDPDLPHKITRDPDSQRPQSTQQHRRH